MAKEGRVKVPGGNGPNRFELSTGALHCWRAWTGRLPAALGISLGVVAADPDCAGRIRAAQIAGVVRLTPFVMAASCLNAAILLVILGSAGQIRPPLLIWSGVMAALAVHYVRAWTRRRSRDPTRPAPP